MHAYIGRTQKEAGRILGNNMKFVTAALDLVFEALVCAGPRACCAQAPNARSRG
jgi:hypothetical protein